MLTRKLLESPPKVVETIGETMKLDLLAIAAHPDDVELTCGGTLIKMAQRGYKTGVLDLTAGEMGTRGTPETRAKESALAAKFMGVSWRKVLGVPDSDVQASRQHKLSLAAVIREVRPRTVIIPYWDARHPEVSVKDTTPRVRIETSTHSGRGLSPVQGSVLHSICRRSPAIFRSRHHPAIREAQKGHSGLPNPISCQKEPPEE
jgi:hypothetical protein